MARLNVHDLKPGMHRVTIALKIEILPDLKRMITSAGVAHEILEFEAGDESGSIKLVLWDEKIIPT